MTTHLPRPSLARILALGLVLVLGACGRETPHGAIGSNQARVAAVGSDGTGTQPRRRAGPDIEAAGYWFRYEGARFGVAALAARFQEDGVAWGEWTGDPDALSSFLAAAKPEVVCRDEESAVIAFYGPLHDALLLTRWSLGQPIRLREISVAPGSTPGAPWWLEALAAAKGEDAVQSVLEGKALERSAAAAHVAPCDPQRAPAATAAPLVTPLVTPRERGLPLAGLVDGRAELTRLHRGLLALFNRGEPAVLERLVDAAQGEWVRGVAAANPRMQLAPVYRISVEDAGRERHLIVYADLLMGGRYVLVSAVMPREEAGAPAGGVEIRVSIARL